MSVLASLSKDVIMEASLSSRYIDRGQGAWDSDLFVKKLGQAVLEQFAGIRLIGEIERIEGKATYETLSTFLSTILSKTFLWQICQNGSVEWRAILSVYFVWTGIFFYGEESGHDLWPAVMKGLGLEADGNLSNRCGQLFIQCVKENNLEEFTAVKSGHSFMTRILLHGLIPRKHIDRFVAELIEPELQSHVGIYATGEHLVQKWRQAGTFRYLPKPIQRFIAHGEPANIHIAERFLDMAKRWGEDDPALWRQWGLPQYMVDAFRRHIKSNKGASLRKSWPGTSKEKPYLCFDLEQTEAPLLCIPAQQIKSMAAFRLKWVNIKGFGREISLQLNATAFDGILYSDRRDFAIEPSTQGWELETINQSTGSVTKQSIHAPMPLGHNGERTPLFVFSRSTGRLLDPGRRESLPEELLLVFPRDAVLEIKGGRFSSEPERLPGAWRDWQYILCMLQGDGSFEYAGPDADFAQDILSEIRFSCANSDDKPEFANSGRAPSWFRCLEGWPIFVDPGSMAITCSESGYPTWRRAFGKLTRLDKTGFAKPLDLDFQKRGQRYEAGIPFPEQCEPGVYEIQLRGPLGIDDVILTFVYLPLQNPEQVVDPETGVTSEFHFGSLEKVAVQSLLHTSIKEDDTTSIISLQEDRGEAFCGLKLFAHSRLPVTLLLARSELRWSRRSEIGLFHWGLWRCRPEEIPVQRLDEIADARVVVQFDGILMNAGRSRTNKLKLLLKTLGEQKDEERVLFSYEAPTFRRNIHDTWIVDLKKFSDLIKSLRSVEAAAVAVQSADDKDELILFTVMKQPTFRDFRVENIGGGNKAEKLRISWTPQRNDPQTHRVVRIFPAGEPRGGVTYPIKDGSLPPVEIPIEPSQKPGLWGLKIEAHQSRFGALGPSADSCSSFTWFRAPANWADWLEWPELRPVDVLERVGSLRVVSKETLEKSLPWSDFLARFHYDKGKDSVKAIRSILGDAVLENLIPYSRGRVWDIKAASGTRATIKITDSSAKALKFEDLFACRQPCMWCRFPDEIELELSLLNSHHYLGKAGSIWSCVKTADDEHACLSSEDGSQLDLPIWLEDAVSPDETGRLVAHCALEALWDTPPYLPVLKNACRKDLSFVEPVQEAHTGTRRPRTQTSGRSLATLGDLLDSRTRGDLAKNLFEVADPEKRAEADKLVDQWRKWAQRSNVNPFLSRMVTGRLSAVGPAGLSGVVALIARLRCRNHWTDRVYGWDADGGKAVNTLYERTLEFVRQTTPKSFLGDLILSEVVISWYWNQSLATI